MSQQIRLAQIFQASLRCPVCRAGLRQAGEYFACASPDCGARFPVVDGIPVLLNEQSSVFTIDDVVSSRGGFFHKSHQGKLKKTILRLIPQIGRNIKARANYSHLSDLLFKQSQSPRVLVLGGSILGDGMEVLANNSSVSLVETDISFGPRTSVICDAHDIPFEDGSFDGVIAQAVLEHVVDPYRCCEEIHRVLKENGVVYAETPFIQQVHGGRYDFTRFTHLGHRRVFRKFEEIESGAVCGPGTALAWSYEYFLLSFTSSRTLRALLLIFASVTSFYLKYFDYYLIDKPGAIDAASGYYFMGRRSTKVLTDRELIKLYRGAV